MIIALAAIGPLFVMLLYSFMVKGDYGDVKYWQFSSDGWFSVFLQRDIFDDTLTLADAHVTIFWRSVKLSLITTLVTLFLGFPTAYFIATRPAKQRDIWLFLITIPFWTNILIRTFAMQEVIRNEGIINTVLIWIGHHRCADPDHVHRLGHPVRHGLCLPAADGAAALCQHGED